jgi:hypothetical protein
MSRSAPVGAAPASGRTAVAGVFILVMVVALVMVVRARPGPEPFDPRSSGPDGTRGLVLLLEASGADVDIVRSPPSPGEDARVLVIADLLDETQRSATLGFIEGGGVAVVADPESTLHGGPGLDGGSEEISGSGLPVQRGTAEQESNLEPGSCSIDVLGGLRGLYVPDGVLYPVGPVEPKCFGDGTTSFVIARSIGGGTVVGLGDNEILTNENLRRADNAGLATALLVPEDGARVVVLLGSDANRAPADIGTGEETLADLVPQWVWMALVLGGLGFVVFAVSRSVRVGRVPEEPLVSPIAGSELVQARGALMQRAGHAPRAAWLLQLKLHRDLCDEFRVDTTAPLAELDGAVATRRGTPPGTIESLLRESIDNDQALLTLSRRIDHLRRDTDT